MLDVRITTGDEIGVGNGLIHAAETTKQPARLQELNDALRHNVVSVDSNLPCCCIDGRSCVQTMAKVATQPRASIAGGQTTPYAAAEITGWFDQFAELSGATSTERLRFLQSFLQQKNITLGNHVDTANEADNFSAGATGCGAADKLHANLTKIYDHAEGVQAFVKLLRGDSYSDNVSLKDKTHVLDALQDWEPVTAMRSLDADAVEVLRADEQGVHGHREFTVVFNFIEDTTIDRDSFVSQTGEQVFVVDMWYITKLAHALAQNDQQVAALQQAMIAYQIGTYLSLCDGSQTYTTITAAA